MKKALPKTASVERSIITKFRERLWVPFIEALKTYSLIDEGDRIAVCISGGKDSMLMAKLMQEIQRHGEKRFETVFLSMDPGYNEINRQKVLDNAELLGVPLTVFKTDIFDIANKTEQSPCYLCARMRRGYLYAKAKELGCNKIALGHHKSDVIETTLMSMMYNGQIEGMLPRLNSENFEGMELIRPLYCILEEDIIKWRDYNGLEFIACACRFTENCAITEGESSARQKIKKLIKSLKKENPAIERNLFKSIHQVRLDTMPGYKADGVEHSFMERLKKENK